ILSLISLLRELAVSELPTGSDEVRKEADPVFRTIGKRFRDVRPVGVYRATRRLRSTHRRSNCNGQRVPAAIGGSLRGRLSAMRPAPSKRPRWRNRKQF